MTMPGSAKKLAEAAESVAEMAHEHVHELYPDEAGYCSICGQPANVVIPPQQSVWKQSVGEAVQVREYPQVAETTPEVIDRNTRSGV